MTATPTKPCRVNTLCLTGASVHAVELELQFTGGLMQRIILTGLTGSTVREARDRIRGALEQEGLPVPRRSVLANFAPADVPKEGNGFDLPLAVGLLALQDVIPTSTLADRVVLGELSLDGRLRPVRGALALTLEASRQGITRVMLPWCNGAEAALVRGVTVEPVRSLGEALDVLRGASPPAPPEAHRSTPTPLDLADVRGQDGARRALEIAAVGAHNLLLSGPPGTGKTMLAQRLPGLLPPLDEDAVIEVSALHGMASGNVSSIIERPPFRAPHHTVSRAGLIGGGRPLVPGEVSLAHRGVLFLDEVAEFPRSLLESLRQPLEDQRVEVARAGRSAVFPAQVQLLAAMNPCPCGQLGHPVRGCSCPPLFVERYRRRLSGPLLDRFDLAVSVPPPHARSLFRVGDGEDSATVAARVSAARDLLGDEPSPPLPNRAEAPVRKRLEQVVRREALSARGLRRTLAVATTIAALDGRPLAQLGDVDEALSLRRGLTRFLETDAL